ncbi:carboxymethylenebutenolidase [Herbihabitans rhizosphaerae]|uniref:Carboxymethylenebutenolidase n=1 Tax=Herbihabitans rhizosphaerae TaxID=1872711 RepID=A0A4Q7KMF7_9PSEU|nr:dienelactone hydrolase family protein [Herbihabitans rhizosphaerae]RZS37869.1 carboxymethylenebutenolidase [Herbihabitans rhizosphaerae]
MDIPVADGVIEGYLARPVPSVSGDGPYPAVVIVPDVSGLTEDARAHADRFATAGYLALAVNLYSRGGLVRCIRSVFRDLLAAKGRTFEDVDAARSLLADRDDCTGKVGVVGFCLGGGFALVAATRGFDAAAPYYGVMPRDLSVLDGSCPMVASFGRKDPMLRGAADTLERKLTEQGTPHDVKEYPDAAHSFANRLPGGPFNVLLKVAGFAYHHESSEDAWRRVMDFFGDHLVLDR